MSIKVNSENSWAFERVRLQRDLLSEIDAISREEPDDIAGIIFQRVLRATQEFRRVYAGKEDDCEDETRIPLRRTISLVALPQDIEARKNE